MGALSAFVHRNRLRGRSLVQVGESCNIMISRYEIYPLNGKFPMELGELMASILRVGRLWVAHLFGPSQRVGEENSTSWKLDEQS